MFTGRCGYLAAQWLVAADQIYGAHNHGFDEASFGERLAIRMREN